MRSVFFNFLGIIMIIVLLGCGSSAVKIAKEPQPLGVVPFTSDNVAGNLSELNQRLFVALEGSGRFRIIPLDTVPGLWNEQQMSGVKDSTLKWILTGKFELENQKTGRGTYFPFIVFKPYVAIQVKAQYRLFNREKNNWAEIRMVEATAKRVNDLQFFEVDPNDPDLQMDAKDREILRQKAYQEVFRKMAQSVSSKMKIK